MVQEITKEYRIFTQEQHQPLPDGYKTLQLALKAFKKAKLNPSVAYAYEIVVDGQECIVNKVGCYLSQEYVKHLNKTGGVSVAKQGWELSHGN